MAPRPGSETPSGTRNPNAPRPGPGQEFGVAHQRGGFAGYAQAGSAPRPAPQAPGATPPGSVPNYIPQWDPFSPRQNSGGLGTAYLNMFRPVGMDAQLQAGNDTIRSNLLNDAAFAPVSRNVPGAGANAMARGDQFDAAQSVAQAGQPAHTELQRIVASGRSVGQSRDRGQAQLDAALFDQAMGRGGPTAAQSMFGSALNQNIRAQRAMSQGVRGGSAAAAMRQGTQAGVQLGLEAQNQAAMLRAQEQQAAQGLLSQNLAQGRAQDLSTLGLRGDLANTAAGASLARAGTAADVLGQLRGQDIAMGQLGLQSRGQDDQVRQQNILNALSAQQLLTNFGLQDQGMLLDAAGIMGNLQTGQQNVANQRRNLELTERGQNMQLAGAGLSAGGSLISGLV